VEDPAHPGEVPGSFVGTDSNKVFVPDPNAKGPDFIVIGTEGGFLPEAAVVRSNGAFDLKKYYAHNPAGYGLVLAGAERADVLIDFSGYDVGTKFILYNDAGSPFPDGGDRTLDYYTGNPDGTGGPEGFGPNTRTMMRIEIGPGYGQPMPSLETINRELAKLNLKLPIPDHLIGRVFDGPPGVVHRNKTLSEGIDKYGRLIAMLGTDDVTNINFTKHGMTFDMALPPNGKEDYTVGAKEVWDIYNTTGDTHPIHFHLVNVQIIGRATFATGDDGGPIFGSFSAWAPPDPDERGWKETVRMDPGQVTRVIMKIELPPDPVVTVFNKKRTVTVPKSPRTGGYEYVWHCHILEHEEHDMMRPFVVRDHRPPR
jgi:spore coat protein A